LSGGLLCSLLSLYSSLYLVRKGTETDEIERREER
jgi:hypothetical protein